MNAARSSTATATIATAEPFGEAPYIGRFAPSPTGHLHWGSLYAAAASYLDARAHGGRWLLRMEDLDRPRAMPGMAAEILRTLDAFGFCWDGPVSYQSDRLAAYAAAIDALRRQGLLFTCSCSRAALGDTERYPGWCRNGPIKPVADAVTRLRVDPGVIEFKDEIQGLYQQDPAKAVGDFVVQRRDQVFAYQLAVVVDDAAQGVTKIVRGSDLLDNTPRQIRLQTLLGLATPAYAHVPVLVEADGSKLAKSKRSLRADAVAAVATVVKILRLLGQEPPPELAEVSLPSCWQWAVAHWRLGRVPQQASLSAALLAEP